MRFPSLFGRRAFRQSMELFADTGDEPLVEPQTRRGLFGILGAAVAATFFPSNPSDAIPPDFLDYGEGMNEEPSSSASSSSSSVVRCS